MKASKLSTRFLSTILLLTTVLPGALAVPQQEQEFGDDPLPNEAPPAAWIKCEFDPPSSFRKYDKRDSPRANPLTLNNTFPDSGPSNGTLARREKMRRGDVNEEPEGDDDARLVIEIDTNWTKFGNFEATVRNGGDIMWRSRCRFDCGWDQHRADWQTMFGTPQIDFPLEMHAGNWCFENSNHNSGWAFDNFWIRYKDFWVDMPSDCDIQKGFTAFGGGGFGYGPWKKAKCRVPLTLKE